MCLVCSSLPFAFAIFAICGFNKFANINFLALFLILGIGADSVFIFTDLWKQSAFVLGSKEDHRARLMYTLQKAEKAVLKEMTAKKQVGYSASSTTAFNEDS